MVQVVLAVQQPLPEPAQNIQEHQRVSPRQSPTHPPMHCPPIHQLPTHSPSVSLMRRLTFPMRTLTIQLQQRVRVHATVFTPPAESQCSSVGITPGV